MHSGWLIDISDLLTGKIQILLMNIWTDMLAFWDASTKGLIRLHLTEAKMTKIAF